MQIHFLRRALVLAVVAPCLLLAGGCSSQQGSAPDARAFNPGVGNLSPEAKAALEKNKQLAEKQKAAAVATTHPAGP